jgi:hypothetical protein
MHTMCFGSVKVPIRVQVMVTALASSFESISLVEKKMVFDLSPVTRPRVEREFCVIAFAAATNWAQMHAACFVSVKLFRLCGLWNTGTWVRKLRELPTYRSADLQNRWEICICRQEGTN